MTALPHRTSCCTCRTAAAAAAAAAGPRPICIAGSGKRGGRGGRQATGDAITKTKKEALAATTDLTWQEVWSEERKSTRRQIPIISVLQAEFWLKFCTIRNGKRLECRCARGRQKKGQPARKTADEEKAIMFFSQFSSPSSSSSSSSLPPLLPPPPPPSSSSTTTLLPPPLVAPPFAGEEETAEGGKRIAARDRDVGKERRGLHHDSDADAVLGSSSSNTVSVLTRRRSRGSVLPRPRSPSSPPPFRRS